MKVKVLHDFDTRSEVVFVHKEVDDPRDSRTNLAQIRVLDKKQLVQVVITESLVTKEQIGLPKNLATRLGTKDGDNITIQPRTKPQSFDIIKRKYNEKITWSQEEIETIVQDIYEGNSTDLEMAAFTLALQYEKLSRRESEFLTRSFAKFGNHIEFKEPVFDKHSIGGIPGNKVSLLIVPIIAAAGLLIPKTSSRAITSPSGTADTMEVLANVSFSTEEIQEIAPKSRGMIVWAGNLNLVPVDSEIINRVERPLRLDPDSVIIASILSKKLSTNVKHMVLDMPTGPGTKVETREEAIALSRAFVEIGQRVGIEIECALTYADQPVGHAIGPALEAREALKTLQGKGPVSVREKSVELAGILLEMSKLAQRGHGASVANDILSSGKALEKFREIIDFQGGNMKVKPEDIPVGQYTIEITAPKDGYISHLSNTAVKQVASVLGCPLDHAAGLELMAKSGEFVKKGSPLLKLYATSESKLDEAMKVYNSSNFFQYEGMVLERISNSIVSNVDDNA